jgi:hypothetical protein
VESFSVSKVVTVDQAKEALLLTYLPEQYAQLERALARSLMKMFAHTSTAAFVEHADLVTGQRS